VELAGDNISEDVSGNTAFTLSYFKISKN